LRVSHLIAPSLATLALAGATASTAGAAVSGGGGMSGAGTRVGSHGTSVTPGTTGLGTSTLPGAGAMTGGAGVGAPPALPFPRPIVPGATAEIIHGLAYAPADAPLQVQQAIWAGDRIRFKPYRVGGGHGKWNDTAYDCSGSVSYVLHAAGLLRTSMDSSEFEAWGTGGAGQWITVYTNPAHAFIEIAGIRFDTSAEGDPHPAPGSGPRWRPVMTSAPGFMARHPDGL
jgi:hypothetical protein